MSATGTSTGGFGVASGPQSAQTSTGQAPLKVTADMINGMKMAVASFMGVGCLLAFFSVLGVVLTPKGDLLLQIIGPTILVAYSFVALIVLRAMWKEFSTKMQLLN